MRSDSLIIQTAPLPGFREIQALYHFFTMSKAANDINDCFQDHRALNDKQLRKRISSELPDPDEYAETLMLRGERYASVAPAVLTLVTQIMAADPELVVHYNRYAYASALSSFNNRTSQHLLPESVRALYPDELKRMRRQYIEFKDTFFTLENTNFVKDIAITKYQLIPLGAEYAEPNGGVSLRLLLRLRQGKRLWALASILWRAGGNRPFYSLHLHALSIRDFDESGCRQMYLRLGALLEANPLVKGMTSASWFLDPAMNSISPHLAHHRQLPETHGALILFLRPEGANSGALEKSAKRRQLFSEGRYVPRVHMRIWVKQDILAWCRAQDSTVIN
ncbi:hypothetical protein N9383_00035 [Granulosicoccus sp.]|nr:hypothetical protein [Granulosicoccus sp.]